MQSCRLLTIQDIAEKLGVERHTAGQYVRQMPCVVLGRVKRVRETDFDQWLLEHTRVEGRKAKSPRPQRRVIPNPQLFEPDGTLKRRRA